MPCSLTTAYNRSRIRAPTSDMDPLLVRAVQTEPSTMAAYRARYTHPHMAKILQVIAPDLRYDQTCGFHLCARTVRPADVNGLSHLLHIASLRAGICGSAPPAARTWDGISGFVGSCPVRAALAVRCFLRSMGIKLEPYR